MLTLFSGLVMLCAGCLLLLLTPSAGFMLGAVVIQNLLVILSLRHLIRTAACLFCLLAAGDVAVALNAAEFLSDAANDVWPSLLNLSLSLVWTRFGGDIFSLLAFSEMLIGAFVIKAVITVWVGCALCKHTDETAPGLNRFRH